MAKIIEQTLTIKFSKLVKDGEATSIEVSDDLVSAVEQIAQELSPIGVVIEVLQK